MSKMSWISHLCETNNRKELIEETIQKYSRANINFSEKNKIHFSGRKN